MLLGVAIRFAKTIRCSQAHLRGGRFKEGDRMTVDHRLGDQGDHARFEYENQFQGFWMSVLRPPYFLMGHAWCRSMIRTLKHAPEADAERT